MCLCLTLLPSTAFAAYTPPMKVDMVSVTVPTLIAGDDLTTPSVGSSESYCIRSSSWTRVAAKGGTASVGDPWEPVVNDNSWYRLECQVELDYGYYFGSSVTVNVSGAETVEIDRYYKDKDNCIYVSAWFKVGNPAEPPETVSAISISDVPTGWNGKVSDWKDKITAATTGSDGYGISYVSISKWENENTAWDYCNSFDTIESGAVYGASLTINTSPGCVFDDDTVTATVNGSAAEIVEHSVDEVKIFVPFGNVTIGSVEVESATWPIDGSTIDKSADNFSFGSVYNTDLCPYTLESAQFQIKDGESYRDLKENETEFSGFSKYRVIAVLNAKGYATFTDPVTGDFNGTSGVNCEISEDKKTCTVTPPVRCTIPSIPIRTTMIPTPISKALPSIGMTRQQATPMQMMRLHLPEARPIWRAARNFTTGLKFPAWAAPRSSKS